MKELDNSKDNYFELVNPVEILGYTAYELVSIEPVTEEIKEPVNVVEKEIGHMDFKVKLSPEEDSPETIGSIQESVPHGW